MPTWLDVTDTLNWFPYTYYGTTWDSANSKWVAALGHGSHEITLRTYPSGSHPTGWLVSEFKEWARTGLNNWFRPLQMRVTYTSSANVYTRVSTWSQDIGGATSSGDIALPSGTNQVQVVDLDWTKDLFIAPGQTTTPEADRLIAAISFWNADNSQFDVTKIEFSSAVFGETKTVGPMYPVSWAYALEIQAHNGSEVLNLYISTAPALVTKSTDTPPITTFNTGLVQPGNYTISSFAGGKTFGKAAIGYGEIILNNDHGQFDFLLDCAFDGRPATLRRIDADLVATSNYPADWETVYTGSLKKALPSYPGYNESTISVQWQDRMVELKVPLPLAIFRGDNVLPNGLEGTADDIANKSKPLVLGKVYETAPLCCNTSRLIYAVSPPTGGMLDLITDWDSISNFDAVTDFFGAVLAGSVTVDGVTENRRSGIANVTVYDGGLEIPQQAEYTDENDMMSNAPSAGYCRILSSRGYVRFGTTPAGQVTVSCTDASGSSHTLGSVVRSILRDYLRWPSTRYLTSDLVALDSLSTHTVGTVVRDTSQTVDQLLDNLCASLGVCYYFDAKGVFRAFQIADPATLPADFDLTDLQTASISWVDNEGIPAKGVRIKHQRCWTVQTSGLLGSVSAARKTWVGTEWRESLATSSTTAAKHLLSQTIEFETALGEPAQDEADRRLAIYSVRRDFLDVDLVKFSFDFTTLRIGMVGNVNLSGRFGYVNKKMMLIGITADLANEKTTLHLWG